VFLLLLHGTRLGHPITNTNTHERPAHPGGAFAFALSHCWRRGGGEDNRKRGALACGHGTNTRTNAAASVNTWKPRRGGRAHLLMGFRGEGIPRSWQSSPPPARAFHICNGFDSASTPVPAAAAGTRSQTLPHHAGQSVGALGQAGAWSTAPTNSGTRDPRTLARRTRSRTPAKTKPRCPARASCKIYPHKSHPLSTCGIVALCEQEQSHYWPSGR
jgi:hypothetical protein